VNKDEYSPGAFFSKIRPLTLIIDKYSPRGPHFYEGIYEGDFISFHFKTHLARQERQLTVRKIAIMRRPAH